MASAFIPQLNLDGDNKEIYISPVNKFQIFLSQYVYVYVTVNHQIYYFYMEKKFGCINQFLMKYEPFMNSDWNYQNSVWVNYYRNLDD